MFRLNFLVVMVMAVTNHEFVRYYICAMHTYWFLSVYAMMAIGKSYNSVSFRMGSLCHYEVQGAQMSKNCVRSHRNYCLLECSQLF